MPYKLCFFVPEENLETVKKAIFTAGGGNLNNYSQCAWQTKGMGQFKPEHGSQPYLGEQHAITRVPEYKVEIFCQDNVIKACIAALHKAHPYEVPAYDVIKLEAL